MVVFGNVIAYNNVDIDLSSYFVVLGNFDQRNGSTVTAPANDTLLYITGTPICGGTATCLPSDLVGGLDDLLNNPALGDLILGYSSIIIAPTTFICPGQSVQLNIRSDGSNYQWYRGTTAIAGATSASYNAVTGGTYDVSYTVNGTNFTRTGLPRITSYNVCYTKLLRPVRLMLATGGYNCF